MSAVFLGLGASHARAILDVLVIVKSPGMVDKVKLWSKVEDHARRITKPTSLSLLGYIANEHGYVRDPRSAPGGLAAPPPH